MRCGCNLTVVVQSQLRFFPKLDVHKHHSNHVSDPRQRNDSLIGAPGLVMATDTVTRQLNFFGVATNKFNSC